MSRGRPARVRLTLTLAALAAAAGVTVLTPGAALATPGRPNLLSMESLFMCTSCHEPLELVQSPQAVSEKQYIAGLIAKGYDRQQIVDKMVQQYGIDVLARPPARGFNLLVYILPPAVLLAGIAFLAFTLPKWRERSRRAAVTPLDRAPPVTSADRERIDEELARMI